MILVVLEKYQYITKLENLEPLFVRIYSILRYHLVMM
nr:MAG TPA: hypothetical protein [Caudoviricetes sp.]